ncbi:hypothetical protein GYMLUDRAFT_179163 [Collybiopsis luxurians FD-317 M1]|uniref:Uncharacterized protein n=1 Tax=Collybiopsis luxurians FD-317 M1 TaxID=944289 RepID=A0A0D0CE69_9AGAR|nr:hypothetical protein GYMLUDRAFT_179163 [Collybiopsis luxurians FD-317 M1]
MSSEDYPHIEQDTGDPTNTDGLPTYEDLAAQNGPNSRFGRWRGWIEKRAAERYADISSEERMRRRERGWGNEEMYGSEDTAEYPAIPTIVNEPPTPSAMSLHIQTNDLQNLHISRASQPSLSPPLPPLPSVSLKLVPTHLRMHNFGSRFLPHTTTPIRCVLPILEGKLLLIGHDEGLSVLDMYPRSEGAGISVKGPEEAQSRPIWTGEGVFQMSVLEMEHDARGTPQGVVLLLVGPEADSPSSSKDSESLRSLRMYNLTSLISLAKWAVTQKGVRPLDLRRPSNWQAQQTPPKRHRPQHSLARGLKNLIDSPGNHGSEHSSSSYQSLLSPSPSVSSTASKRRSRSVSPGRQDSSESASWDVIDDLPLRWATDFVPLATPGSRLSTSSVLSYTLWGNEDRSRGRESRLLAIATKSTILLYETPRGERAFHFLKEFYTPLVPRSITFFQQSVTDVTRSFSDSGYKHTSHRRTDSSSTSRESHRLSTNTSGVTLNYGTQLSLFVIFDKKAGWIRLADSAVGEMEMHDESQFWPARETTSPTSHRKSRISMDTSSIGKWIPPAFCELPVSAPGAPLQAMKVIMLTRGKRTHILPSPLPTNHFSLPPIRSIMWRNTPTDLVARIFEGSEPDMDGFSTPAYLQLISLGELGIEVQEISLPSLFGKGKGKARADDSFYAEEDTGGDAGFLCTGGHWDRQHTMSHSMNGLNRSYSSLSSMSGVSMDSTQLELEKGLYCWCRKGLEDFRVFWLGGSLTADYEDEEQ